MLPKHKAIVSRSTANDRSESDSRRHSPSRPKRPNLKPSPMSRIRGSRCGWKALKMDSRLANVCTAAPGASPQFPPRASKGRVQTSGSARRERALSSAWAKTGRSLWRTRCYQRSVSSRARRFPFVFLLPSVSPTSTLVLCPCGFCTERPSSPFRSGTTLVCNLIRIVSIVNVLIAR